MIDPRTGDYVYVTNKGVSVHPMNTVGEDFTQWQFEGPNGEIYNPHNAIQSTESQITQGKQDTGIDQILQYSNKHYNDPILGSPARFRESLNNNTNPIKGVWNYPGFAFVPQKMYIDAVGRLLGDNGIEKTLKAYTSGDVLGGTKSLLGDVLDVALAKSTAHSIFGRTKYIPYENVTANTNGVSYNQQLNFPYHNKDFLKFSRDPNKITLPNNVVRNIQNYNRSNLSYKMEDLVDELGNINTKNTISVLRKLIRDNDTSLTTAKYSYRDHANIQKQSLLRHLYEVAKTAQTLPVPKGSTKQKQVFEALAHDIGKIIKRQKGFEGNHESRSAQLVQKTLNDVPQDVINAIGNHMKNIAFATDDIKALHAADVGAGIKGADIIQKHPYLGYTTSEQYTNLGKPLNEPLRTTIRTRLNPYFDTMNLPRIPLNATPEQARSMVRDNMRLYRTVGRGVSINLDNEIGIQKYNAAVELAKKSNRKTKSVKRRSI